MCELFGMSSSIPATVNLSLEEFAKHGGLTGVHKDGWGIVYYKGHDIQRLREARAASTSPLVRFVRESGLASELVISHIRRATQGTNALKNTQPFSRELAGRMHTFAHNGDLQKIQNAFRLKQERFLPIGETDSEFAFCLLLERLVNAWAGDKPPSLQQRLDIISRFAEDIRELGPANFLYADSEFLFAHGHKRTQSAGGIHPPGLHFLTRTCPINQTTMNIPGLSISPNVYAPDNQVQKVVLIASVPLSDEAWSPLQEGEILATHYGTIQEHI